MNKHNPPREPSYYEETASWARDREAQRRSSLRTAWIIAGIAALVALAEAFALMALSPLKTVVPYTLLVDRQTGYVQALRPLDQDVVAPERALTQSLLAQYVLAREGFLIQSLKDDYRKVILWSSGEAREQYIASAQITNPRSYLATLPRNAIVAVEVRGISDLSDNTAMVRFVTYRADGGARRDEIPWSAVISYRFSGEPMSAEDRLQNPLGFQVTRYRRNADIPLTARQEPFGPARDGAEDVRRAGAVR